MSEERLRRRRKDLVGSCGTGVRLSEVPDVTVVRHVPILHPESSTSGVHRRVAYSGRHLDYGIHTCRVSLFYDEILLQSEKSKDQFR